jgi:hypothetical protein
LLEGLLILGLAGYAKEHVPYYVVNARALDIRADSEVELFTTFEKMLSDRFHCCGRAAPSHGKLHAGLNVACRSGEYGRGELFSVAWVVPYW